MWLTNFSIDLPTFPKHFDDIEALHLHAEIKALQETLGISYKDATHRLYMTEVEKMKIEKMKEVSFAKIRFTIDNTINNEIDGPISEIDSNTYR